MAYQSYFVLPEIIVLENMRQEVANARESMQIELNKKVQSKEVEESQVEEMQKINAQITEKLSERLLREVVEDGIPRVGKTRIIRAMEELKHKIISLFVNKERNDNKVKKLARNFNDEIE